MEGATEPRVRKTHLNWLLRVVKQQPYDTPVALGPQTCIRLFALVRFERGEERDVLFVENIETLQALETRWKVLKGLRVLFGIVFWGGRGGEGGVGTREHSHR